MAITTDTTKQVLGQIADKREIILEQVAKITAQIAQAEPRYLEGLSLDLQLATGFLSGLKDAEWYIIDIAERGFRPGRPGKNELDDPFLTLATQLKEISDMLGHTAVGVNLNQKSPDYVQGRVNALRGVSSFLLDAFRDLRGASL
jgi:hypothetical protein